MSPSVGSQPHILVVDDDTRIRQMFLRYLTGEGFLVSAACTGKEMRDYLALGGVDLVLLDLMLPGEDGFQLTREIRAQTGAAIGIIIVTGRSDTVDTVVGLEIGADDYIAKPFQLREVLARIKSVLRRQKAPTLAPLQSELVSEEIIRFDSWRLDIGRRELTSPAGSLIPLTTGEFDLLVTFVKHAGRVLSRDILMDLTRGRHWDVFDRSIDTQVARLRRKIEADPKSPLVIKSVRGVGYMFAARINSSGESGVLRNGTSQS